MSLLINIYLILFYQAKLDIHTQVLFDQNKFGERKINKIFFAFLSFPLINWTRFVSVYLIMKKKSSIIKIVVFKRILNLKLYIKKLKLFITLINLVKNDTHLMQHNLVTITRSMQRQQMHFDLFVSLSKH